MGFFDFLKRFVFGNHQPENEKKEVKFVFTVNGAVITPNDESNDEPTDFDHLTKDGDLPTGWLYRNKEFVDQINADYSYFLHSYSETKYKSPKEKYPALKSLVLFLGDAERLCKRKGECFEFWFYELIASKDYMEKRKSELDELTTNFDALQKEYEIKAWKREEQERKTIEMKDDVILLLKANDGILQSDFWKLFDDENSREAAKNIVYSLFHEGKIERTQSGRSFVLHYKE